MIGGFGVVVALMSFATATALVLVVPAPPADQTAPLFAMTALCCGGQGFEQTTGREPVRPRASSLEQLFAVEMQRNPADIRVVWLDGRRRVGADAMTPDQLGALTSRQRRSILLRERPAVRTAARRDDGLWTIVEPDPSWLNGWRLKVLALLAVGLLLLASLALMLARHLTRPFRRLAGALDGGSQTLPIEGPRELRDAVVVIADTRQRLENEVRDRHRILSAAVHDIRTPLTALKVRVADVEGPARARMIADIERMQHMVDEVLEFGRAAVGRREFVEIRGTLHEAIADLTGNRSQLRLLAGPEAWVETSTAGLRRAVENLLRNALQHAGGGEVTVSVGQQTVIISVRDAGPGMVREVAHGGGLGLGIVQSFADREGGRLLLEPGPNGGTIATLELPVVVEKPR